MSALFYHFSEYYDGQPLALVLPVLVVLVAVLMSLTFFRALRAKADGSSSNWPFGMGLICLLAIASIWFFVMKRSSADAAAIALGQVKVAPEYLATRLAGNLSRYLGMLSLGSLQFMVALGLFGVGAPFAFSRRPVAALKGWIFSGGAFVLALVVVFIVFYGIGATTTFSAVAAVSPAQKAPLLAMGMSEAHAVLLVGKVIVLVVLGIFLLGALLICVVERNKGEAVRNRALVGSFVAFLLSAMLFALTRSHAADAEEPIVSPAAEPKLYRTPARSLPVVKKCQATETAFVVELPEQSTSRNAQKASDESQEMRQFLQNRLETWRKNHLGQADPKTALVALEGSAAPKQFLKLLEELRWSLGFSRIEVAVIEEKPRQTQTAGMITEYRRCQVKAELASTGVEASQAPSWQKLVEQMVRQGGKIKLTKPENLEAVHEPFLKQ